MKNTNIAFIGAGNMARALVVGLISTGYPAKNIYVSNPSSEKLHFLQEKFGINVSQSNREMAEKADVIVFAVKPLTTPTVCNELKDIIAERKPLLISVITGVSVAKIEEWVDGKPSVVHAMPNTPAAVSAGATGLFANAHTTDEEKDLAEMLFRSVGVAVWLEDENQIDLVIALSGSGPAYYFLFMEAMQEAAQSMGLSHDVARLLTSQTVLGAARMAMETEGGVLQLRESVTSPNGTTEAAINVFEAGNIRRIIADAMQAACNRSKALAAELEKN